MVAIARVLGGEDCVLPQKLAGADVAPLTEIDRLIRQAKEAPIDQVAAFHKMLRGTRPRGRCAAVLAGRAIRAPVRQPFRQLRGDLGRGLWRRRTPPLAPGPTAQLRHGQPDQTIEVVIRWDHRVTDGAPIAKALTPSSNRS